MLEILAAKLAGAVLGATAGAAVKRLLPGPGAGVATTPTFPRLRLKQPASVDEDDVKKLAKHVSTQLAEFMKRENPSIPEHEKEAALILAVESISLSSTNLWECDLNPESFGQIVLRESSSHRTRAALSGAGDSYYETLVREISLQLAQFITSWPTFAARVEIEQLSRLRSLLDSVNTIQSKLGPGPHSEDLQFEGRYAAQVAEYLNRIQIFGLDLANRNNRSYDLSTAYITLSVTSAAPASTPKIPHQRHNSEHFIDIDEDIDAESIVRGAGQADSGIGMQAESAVSSYKRILLRGDAGSGKTTLLHWLAINAANRSFSAELSAWNILVPFFLPLRRYANTDLPRPSQFFPVVGTMLSEEMPDKWVSKILRSGRGLVLIDGVDELPSEQRAAAREWLRSLISTHPEARYIVTSRPAAAEVDWLKDDGFAVLDMLPMNQKDVEKFVEHWHFAAKEGEVDQEEILSLTQGETDLINAIREERQLRRLASNPLLCALLCTLNRDRHSQLPRDRMELYRAALDLLLLRRDRERKISYPEPSNLGDSQKKSILGEFAHWLIRNGLTDASKDQAINQVSLSLQSMPAIEAEAEAIFEYLMVRSGCLRKPVPDRVDFVHRTFQEFLAAARIVEIDDFDNLLLNAHLDQWHEVFVMAVGHARPKERSRLLAGLIERGDKEPENKKKLHLLAAACLETALECNPPSVYNKVREITAELIPPRRMTDAKELAAAGDLVIPLIPARRFSASEAAATIRMAALVSGDGALSLISRFARDKRKTVQREIRQAWEYFDAEEYARRILSQDPESWRSASIYLPHMLWGLRHLPELKYVQVICRVNGTEWARGLDSLETLSLHKPVRDLSFAAIAAGCMQVRQIDLSVANATDSFEQLTGLRQLERLNILRMGDGSFSLASFPYLPQLKRLSLHGSVGTINLVDLAVKSPNLRSLWLSSDPTPIDTSGLAGMNQLNTLMMTVSRDSDLSTFAEAPHLKNLSLRTTSPVDTSVLATSKSLQKITVTLNGFDSQSTLTEFDLRPFIETRKSWRIKISRAFDCLLIGSDHPAVKVVDVKTENRHQWEFEINEPDQEPSLDSAERRHAS
ncbi:NACHT domain-containing protein [Streptomyces sp. NPDC005795]|uniref:NACHT domain-containing protein n=1 Tax=Streptomyces sp. NPDC005795 TaxID=3154677 RepID=UPI0033F01B5A